MIKKMTTTIEDDRTIIVKIIVDINQKETIKEPAKIINVELKQQLTATIQELMKKLNELQRENTELKWKQAQQKP
jgi:hypothetical protein